ncbi:MAG: hypothetical protein ACFFBX_05085 [Promethearchaeota archaeon]
MSSSKSLKIANEDSVQPRENGDFFQRRDESFKNKLCAAIHG